MLRLLLRAQQAIPLRFGVIVLCDVFGDPAALHDRVQPLPILRPRQFPFFVGLHQLRRGRKQFVVDELRMADFPQKERNIGILGKPRKLGRVVQADVDDRRDAIVAQERKELLCAFLRETDGVDAVQAHRSFTRSFSAKVSFE